MTDTADAGHKHTIPVIDRMMEVLGVIERRGTGLTIRELTEELSVPRTTIYRILNTLQRHGMAWRDAAGAYHLGRRLLSLASHVAAQASDVDIAVVAEPFLDKLAAELGDSVKLSVIDGDGILVIAVAQGRREYALTVAPGQRIPAHVGAASKVLLAYQPPEALERWLSRPLAACTAKTTTDPKRLTKDLAKIRRLGWAHDKGEHIASINAFAAPVLDGNGKILAALSVPFLAGTEASRMEVIRIAAIDTARAISAALPE